MRRGELGESLNMSVDMIAAGRPNRPGTPITVSKLTIHNTSNTAKGANAKAHAKWVRETGYYVLASGKKNWVSWHFTVDDGGVIQHLPLHEKGWHAGPGNSVSLGIEICMNQGIDQQMAFDRAARLCACLLYDLGLKSSDVVTHKHWTGKGCPVLLLDASRWNAFVAQIEFYLDTTMAETLAVNDVPEEVFQPVMCDEPACIGHGTGAV